MAKKRSDNSVQVPAETTAPAAETSADVADQNAATESAGSEAAPITASGTGQETKPAADVDMIFVRSVSERRCRAGFVFDREGLGLALDILTPVQLEAIEGDPLLKVERCTFPAEDENAE